MKQNLTQGLPITKESKNNSNTNITSSCIINGENLTHREKIHSSFIQPSSESLSRESSQASFSNISVAQSQQIFMMQKQHQSTIRGYEIKLKTLNQEYRRMKKEMETKIKELFHEKNYWQNMAMKLYEQKNINESLIIFNEQNMQTNGNYNVLQKDYYRQKQKIQWIESQNKKLQQEKQELMRELDAIYSENKNTKAKLGEYSQQISKLKAEIVQLKSQPKTTTIYKQPPQRTLIIENKKNQTSSTKKIPQAPQHNIQRDLDAYKSKNETYKKMITNLNQQIVLCKLTKLNEKYERSNGVSYSSYSNASFSRSVTSSLNSSSVANIRYRHH